MEHLGIGFCLGSLFGHSTLSSAWIALGPGRWPRLPFAIAWQLAFPLAFHFNTMLHRGPESAVILFCTFMILLLVQVLAWPMRYWLGLRVCRPICDPEGNESEFSRQFGIRDLMIVTTAVALVIGIARALMPFILKTASHEIPIFAFLIVAACIICIPLCFSILAMRKPVLPTLFVLAFVTLATAFEIPLLDQMGLATRGPDWLHITLMNAFSLLPVAIVSVGLRYSGFRLSAM